MPHAAHSLPKSQNLFGCLCLDSLSAGLDSLLGNLDRCQRLIFLSGYVYFLPFHRLNTRLMALTSKHGSLGSLFGDLDYLFGCLCLDSLSGGLNNLSSNLDRCQKFIFLSGYVYFLSFHGLNTRLMVLTSKHGCLGSLSGDLDYLFHCPCVD